MPACVLYRLFRMALPCHALFACLCHNPMPATLLFALPLCLHHHHVRQDRQCLQGLPCRQPHHGDCSEQPVHRLLHSVHFVFCISPFPFHEPETAVSSLATSSCTKAPATALGSLATYSNGLWDDIWYAGLGWVASSSWG